jgi:Flp pilus assembly protein TadG
MRRTLNLRERTGSYLAETAATVAFALPLTFWAIMVTIEASQVLAINQALQQAARAAARNLATQYAVDPGIITNSTDQSNICFLPIVTNALAPNGPLSNAIGDTSQFQTSSIYKTTSPVFTTTTSPGSVTVTVYYASGKFGLPVFPQTDPLFLGSSFQMSQSSSYNLE